MQTDFENDLRRFIMGVKKRTGSVLFLVAGALAMLYVGGCIESPTDNNIAAGPSSAEVCDNVFGLNPGGLYRATPGGALLEKLPAGDLDMPWEAYVDPGSGALYFTEDGTGDCSGSIKRILDPTAVNVVIETFVSNADRPRRPVVFGGYLYYTEYKENGSVMRVSLANPAAKTRLAGGLSRPFGIAVDSDLLATWIYFIEMGNSSNGTVKKLRLDNDPNVPPTTQIMAQNLRRPVGLVMDDFYVYVAEMDGGRVFRMSKAAPINLPDSPEQENLVTGLSTPYPPVLETSAGLGSHTLFFADFSAGDTNAGKIYRRDGVDGDTPTVGTTPTPTPVGDCDGVTEPDCKVLADTLSWPMLVAVDGTNIYWSEVFSSSVKETLKGGGIVPIELANEFDVFGISKPLGIATDGTYVYFSDLGNNLCCF